MERSAALQINRLRLRTRSDQDLNHRLRTATLLDQGDFRPAGLPPSIVLVIRRMQDPLPGEFLPNPENIRLNPAWESSVKSRLASYYRQAARPIAGAVPESAMAVVFSNQAEMLACLAMDLHRKTVLDQWWWHSILRRYPLLPDPEGWYRLLCENALQVPKMLDLLQKNHTESALLETLTGAQSLRVLEAVLETYQLGGLLQNVTSDASSINTSANISQGVSGQDSPGDAGPERVNQLPVPPWEVALNSGLALKNWPREQEALRGICLLLTKYPGLLRTTRFRRSFREWWTTVDRADQRTRDIPDVQSSRPGISSEWQIEKQSSKDVTRNSAKDTTNELDLGSQSFTSETESHESISDSTEGHSFPREEAGASSNDLQDGRGSESVEIASGDLTGQKNRDLKAQNRLSKDGSQSQIPSKVEGQDSEAKNLVFDGVPNPKVRKHSARDQKQDAAGEPATIETHSDKELQSSPDQKSANENLQNIDAVKAEPDLWTGESHIHTGFAGIFYLVNFLEYLQVPELFDEPWNLMSQVSPWALLDIIARGFVSEAGLDLREDPLWRLLAILDGREQGTMPGEGYQGSEEFRLPVRWLEQAGTDALKPGYWAWTKSRLAMWAANGVLLFDVPRSNVTPTLQTNLELSRLGYQALPKNLPRRPYPRGPKIQVVQASQSPANGLTRWLSWAMPYLRYRLSAALSDEQDSLGQSITSLLWCSGDIFVTSSHIDVVIPLENISLPARMAGLDRDPGWKPLFGRVILFHFE